MNSFLLLFVIGAVEKPIVQFVINPYSRSGKAFEYAIHIRSQGYCEIDPLYHLYQGIKNEFNIQVVDSSKTDLFVEDTIKICVNKQYITDVNECGCGCGLIDVREILWEWQLCNLEIMFDGNFRKEYRKGLWVNYETLVIKWIKEKKVKNDFEIICPECRGLKRIYGSTWGDDLGVNETSCNRCNETGKIKVHVDERSR